MTDLMVWSDTTNLDLEVMSPEERLGLLKKVTEAKAMAVDGDKPRWMHKTLHLKQLMGHPARVADSETGELQTLTRVVFVSEEVSLSFVSKAAVEFAELVVAVMGTRTFNPPIPWQFAEVPTKRGRTYSFLVED
jgi:hypothetical protein